MEWMTKSVCSLTWLLWWFMLRVLCDSNLLLWNWHKMIGFMSIEVVSTHRSPTLSQPANWAPPPIYRSPPLHTYVKCSISMNIVRLFLHAPMHTVCTLCCDVGHIWWPCRAVSPYSKNNTHTQRNTPQTTPLTTQQQQYKKKFKAKPVTFSQHMLAWIGDIVRIVGFH